MRYYLISALLITFAIIFVSGTPFLIGATDDLIISWQIPLNNSQVAGVQKYNLPPVSKNIPPPAFSARAILIKDLATGEELFQLNSNDRLPIASTTKIITALVASEHFKQNTVLTVNQSAAIPGSRVGLFKGEDLSFRSLLYGMLLSSGNDAAFTLAENYPGGMMGFVSAMNKKAMDLGLKNSHFENPAGFDNTNHYSSARDLARITEEALKNSALSRIFATKETNIVSLDKKYTHQLFNLNKLLSSVKGVLGVKTGTTEGAKENLVTLVEREDHRVLLVVLGSEDRFGETTRLIDWTYENFIWPRTDL